MENSFFEYRDETAADSGSETEFIDNSLADDSFAVKKKNHTVFVAESEESTSDEEEDDEMESDDKVPNNMSKSAIRKSVTESHVISSSDDDGSRRGSIRRQSESSNKLVLSSSDDDGDISPEIVPKRKPPMRKKSSDGNESIIGRKTKKRMILMDSDTENSIIIEHDKHKKLQCMKDTPLKIDFKKSSLATENSVKQQNKSITEMMTSDDDDDDDDKTKSYNISSKVNESVTNNVSETDEEEEEENNPHNISEVIKPKTSKPRIIDSDDELNDPSPKADKTAPLKYDSSNDEAGDGTDDEGPENVTDDEEPDEDHLVMSRATRMSIMGVVPKGNESDESDFIQSDDSRGTSARGSTISLTDLPETSLAPKSPEKPTELPVQDQDSSRITCSPFSSPLHDITNKSLSKFNENRQSFNKNDECVIIDSGKNTPVKVASIMGKAKENFIKYDDDVTIIDTKTEIIALSSDDEEDYVVKEIKKSPNPKRTSRSKDDENSLPSRKISENIKKYLPPPSYPNQEVVYVKRQVRDNELMKYEALQEDLKHVRYLMDEIEVSTLPDEGRKLMERLTNLEMQVRQQGEKVANMVVEPDNPTAADIARDGFGKEKERKSLTWEELQKASNAVQPRMFGKQAMATHMAERNLILDRLRDLYESLATRPAETQLANAPRALATKMMPHQLHALAWLRWRETQRPRAGILADDMGLGKTITMIALIASDKEDHIDDDEDDDDDYPAKGKLTRGGTLVVCPASLMQQWGGEVVKHCCAHALSVCQHHGAGRAQQPHRLASYDLVLTTYNIMQRDMEKNGVLMRVQWRRIILDEAHIVRNHKSATCNAANALRGARRWCLTGTPVQNKDLDLFALLKFLRCSPFDDLTMWKKWIDNKSLGGQERLHTIMQCLLLRRTKLELQAKGQLNCLPEKNQHVKQVTLSQAEMNVYQKVLVFSKTLFAQFLHQRAEKNADAEGFTSAGKDTAYAKMHKKMIALQGAKPVKSHEILVLLLRLRQVCCHCGLIAAMLDEESSADVNEDPAGQDLLAELNKLSIQDNKDKRKSKSNQSDDEEEGPVESTTAAEAIRSVLSPNNPVFELSRLSSKISAVMDCLNNEVFSNKGDKAVVVSQWTSVLRLVEQELNKKRIRSVTLSGAVPVPQRPPLIDAINNPNSDVKVMLLSLCAGGVGLNLCGANHLLLLDPHWNPQLEEQAQDRIYRVGQKKDVHIYRFMCVDTVEQSIRKLQEAKLQLADNVLTGTKNSNNSKLSIEELKILFNMGQ